MKYIIKFKKTGKIRFIAHLDLQKVFLRLFRIVGVKPRYSNGYNPHPKLSFVQPLSLGFASEAEYMELETEDGTDINMNDVKEKLVEYMPDGLTIEYIKEKPDFINKKLASYMDRCEYTVNFPIFGDVETLLKEYINRQEIIYEKTSRKTGKTKEINLKPMIYKLDIIEGDNNNITLAMLLHAGTDTVLNPNVLMESIFDFSSENFDSSILSVNRKKVFCNMNNQIIDIDNLF